MLKTKTHRLTYVLVLLLLPGCFLQYSTDRFKNTSISGEIFSSELARLYKEFSESEVDGTDWAAARYFANKGIRAANGIEVDPEHPEDWNISETLLPTLLNARRLLLDVVSGEVIATYPKQSAKAYFLFDCWVEEMEEGQEDDISNCRNGFYDTIDWIQNPPADEVKVIQTTGDAETEKPSGKAVPTTKVEGKDIVEDDKAINEDEKKFIGNQEVIFEEIIAPEAKSEPKSESNKEAENPQEEQEETLPSEVKEAPASQSIEVQDTGTDEQKSFYLFFDASSAQINEFGISVIADIVHLLSQRDTYEITALGYVGQSDEIKPDVNLAELRAEAVFNALTEQGVKKDSIEYYGFSETAPVEESQSEEKAKASRRVEIYIK